MVKLRIVSGIAVLALSQFSAAPASADAADTVTSANTANPVDLIVAVTGVKTDIGNVGCALFSGAAGFPLSLKGSGLHSIQWLPARRGTIICRFQGVSPGEYAVAVDHDANLRNV
jgi:uncharacterized protein (DUF2141 family)